MPQHCLFPQEKRGGGGGGGREKKMVALIYKTPMGWHLLEKVKKGRGKKRGKKRRDISFLLPVLGECHKKGGEEGGEGKRKFQGNLHQPRGVKWRKRNGGKSKIAS